MHNAMMKNITIILLYFLLPLWMWAASGQQDLITEGDTAYKAERYHDAVEK